MKQGEGIEPAAREPRCTWVCERLGAYLDGTLNARSMRRAIDHLAECEPCRDEAMRLEEALASVREFREVLPGPGFEEGVWTRIRLARDLGRPSVPEGPPLAERVPFGRRSLGWGLAGLAAAASLFLIVGVRTGALDVPFGEERTVPVAQERGVAPAETASHTSPLDRPSADRVLAANPGRSGEAPGMVEESIPQPVGYDDEFLTGQPYGHWSTPTPVGYGTSGAASPQYRYDRVERIANPNAPGGDYLVIRRVVQQRGSSGDGRISF